jgi:signal transduction histidine kinase
VADDATAGSREAGAATTPAGLAPRRKIIVVDDEAGIRRGCQRVLTAEGHEVLAADSAEQALAVLAHDRGIEVALVDLRMPGMGGMELLAQLPAVAPDVVRVVITAYATIESAVEATRRGAFDFLAKPFTPDDLTRLTNKALEQARLIREHKRLQAERESRLLELSTEQSRLRSVVNSMADGVLVCNSEGALVLYNPAALRVMPHLQPGAGVYALREVVASDDLLQTIGEAGTSHTRLSREIQLPEELGGTWILADVAPVVDEVSATSLGTVTVLRDITELHRVEQVKAQFVNMVAHELRAPLAAIDGYLSVLIEGLVTSPEKSREMMSRSRLRLKALLDLVGDLLDVARMEAGTVRREIALQRPGDIVAEVLELMQPAAQAAGIELRNELPAALPGVEADREELIRLINNLVSNAIKYNKLGGSVTVTGSAEGPYVRLNVTDTGMGIGEEGIRNLFTEFFREKRRETSQITGTGLGLSIVKRIVDFYHGRIDVQSKLDEGSTFSVWLPCVFEAGAAKPETSPAS